MESKTLDLKTLVEETYPIGRQVDEIFREYLEPMINRIKRGEKIKSSRDHIKSYFKNLVERDDWELRLVVLIKDRIETPTMNVYKLKSGKAGYEIRIPVYRKTIVKREKQKLREQFKELLFHEITHVLDRIRAGHKDTSLEYWKSDKSSIDTSKYYKDPGEINAIIAELKQYRKTHKREWDNETVDSGRLYHLMKSLQSQLGNLDINQRNSFMKKIIKRLYREGLLSKKWTGKIKK